MKRIASTIATLAIAVAAMGAGAAAASASPVAHRSATSYSRLSGHVLPPFTHRRAAATCHSVTIWINGQAVTFPCQIRGVVTART